MKTISLIGSTGSIGTQAADVARQRGFKIRAIAAGSNIERAEAQIREFSPEVAAISDEKAAAELKKRTADTATRIVSGEEGVEYAASLPVDAVLNGVVGIAGLKPTVAALSAGNILALANKESLVCAGDIVMALAEKKGLKILPVDSEHSAVFQSLGAHTIAEVEKIILTASGGPFYGFSKEELEKVTPEQALCHPSWKMGKKITIDCATMMNKGFELMEARYLFNAPAAKLSYVIHRESLVHSMVQFRDGALMAQISPPDMRLPIVYALDYPVRYENTLKRFDFFDKPITFLPPREDVFPAPKLCLRALEKGGNAGAVVNGANEQAVKLFLAHKIGFTDITRLVSEALDAVAWQENPEISDIFQADAAARRFIQNKVVFS